MLLILPTPCTASISLSSPAHAHGGFPCFVPLDLCQTPRFSRFTIKPICHSPVDSGPVFNSSIHLFQPFLHIHRKEAIEVQTWVEERDDYGMSFTG